MNSDKWNECAIASAIARQTLQSRCVLLVDRCRWTGHECDVLGVTKDLRIIDVEIKISRADLRADASKDKWWQVRRWPSREPRPSSTRRQHPPRVWKHYYALPDEIWDDALLESLASPASGVLLLSRNPTTGHVWVKCRRRAKPERNAYQLSAQEVMDIARLANLRMWDAYERERINGSGRG